MAGVEDWSVVASSNTASPPTGAPEGMAPSTVNDTMRQMMANVRKEWAFNSLTATTTMSIGSLGYGYATVITDANKSISSFDTIAAGVERELVFGVAATLVHDATKMILPGAANITAAAGDVARFRSEGSGNWRCVSYMPAAQTPSYNGTYRSVQVYTSTGANTWNKPTGLKRVKVTVVGGGGSGGGGDLDGSFRGTGGGGGGVSIKTIEAASLGATETATVGAGGAAVAAANSPTAGNAGGTSSFGAHCTATGGAAGAAGITGAIAGSAGGVGASGDINLYGGYSFTKEGTGDDASFAGTGGNAALGYGFGGQNVGQVGVGYGGGGAAGNHTAGNSGAGANGIIIVEEFF